MSAKKTHKRIKVGDYYVDLFDGYVDVDLQKKTFDTLSDLSYESDHYSNKMTRKYREWASEIDLSTFKKQPIFRLMQDLVRASFPDRQPDPFSVFCNCISFGSYTFTHQDGGVGCFSALYYANPEWLEDWAGETLLFDENLDALACIPPVPGRIIVMDGRINHRAGVPSRSCPHRRYTLSLRFDEAVSSRNGLADDKG